MQQHRTEESFIDKKRNTINFQAVENITDVVGSNIESQADSNNGFTTERTLRKVADIPVSVFHTWARTVGYNQMDKSQKKMAMWSFLTDNPQYRTVTSLKNNTANQGSIIIK